MLIVTDFVSSAPFVSYRFPLTIGGVTVVKTLSAARCAATAGTVAQGVAEPQSRTHRPRRQASASARGINAPTRTRNTYTNGRRKLHIVHLSCGRSAVPATGATLAVLWKNGG